MGVNRKDKFLVFSAITGAIQRLEKLSRANYIYKIELVACLLSQSTLSSWVLLLLVSEHDIWVREMTVPGLDFKNPVGLETFNCFKRVCIIERNTKESARSDPIPKEAVTTAVKKTVKSSYNVSQVEIDDSGDEEEATVHAAVGPPPKPWNPPQGLKFPCPLGNYVHEVSKCAEFFNLTPLDRWEKIETFRICYTCLKLKTVCKGKRYLIVCDVQ